MKQITFAALAIFLSLSSVGQTPQYYTRYLMPECMNNTSYFTNPVSSSNLPFQFQNQWLTGIAQPYYTSPDSLIVVKGISFLTCQSYSLAGGNNCAQYLEISKYPDNPISMIRYDTCITTLEYQWVELFFDTSILICDTFYVAATLPVQFLWNPLPETSLPTCGEAYIYTTTPKTCVAQLTPLLQSADNMVWRPFASATIGVWGQPVAWYESVNPSLFIFPILDTIPFIAGRIDTSFCNNDTASHRVFLTTTINTQTYPTSALIMEVGFIYSTDTYEELILDNPNVNYVSIPYDSTTNTYTMAFPYSQLPCQYIYYRSYVKTVIETSYDTMEHVNYGETNFFIKREESSVETLPASYDTDQQCVVMNMNVTNYGCPSATAYGFVYDKDSTNLNLENGYVHTNSTNTSLSYLYLQYDTIYYYKAFITSNGQTHYGNTEQFSIQDNSLNEIIDSDNIAKLYPNPTDKELTIETTIPIQKIEIVNSNGQTIYTIEPNKKVVKINTSKFVSGNYIAVITTSKAVLKRQFVVR